MLKKAKRTFALLALTTLVGCNAYLTPATPPTTVPTPMRIHSTPATFPLLETLSSAYIAEYPSRILDHATATHETSLQRLRGDPSGYFISMNLPQEEQLWAAPLAQDGLAIIVHPSNPVRSLTIEQIRRLYRGYSTNWQDVQGADLNVLVFSHNRGTDLRTEFERLVMGQERTTPNAQLLPSTEAVIAQVAANPGAIGYVPLSQSHADVATLAIGDVEASLDSVAQNIYPLRTVIYIIGADAPVGTYRDFIGWAQGASGQASFAGQFAPLP